MQWGFFSPCTELRLLELSFMFFGYADAGCDPHKASVQYFLTKTSACFLPWVWFQEYLKCWEVPITTLLITFYCVIVTRVSLSENISVANERSAGDGAVDTELYGFTDIYLNIVILHIFMKIKKIIGITDRPQCGELFERRASRYRPVNEQLILKRLSCCVFFWRQVPQNVRPCSKICVAISWLIMGRHINSSRV